MVARRLSEVAGDGQAFRCGGEEFAIVFRNTSAQEAYDHLDALRHSIENSTFHVRGAQRRAERVAGKTSDFRTAESDRRKSARKSLKGRALSRAGRPTKSQAALSAAASPGKQEDLFPEPANPLSNPVSNPLSNRLPDRLSDHLSVTVSIGVAEPSTRNRQPEQVIQAADQALYRAKHKGRNRVELAATAPLRIAASKRSKASRL
jgi:GGDEF domain-containing protein